MNKEKCKRCVGKGMPLNAYTHEFEPAFCKVYCNEPPYYIPREQVKRYIEKIVGFEI